MEKIRIQLAKRITGRSVYRRIFAACKFLNYEQKRKSAGGHEWRY